eukprot:3789357-Amphidinium_carterae.1
MKVRPLERSTFEAMRLLPEARAVAPVFPSKPPKKGDHGKDDSTKGKGGQAPSGTPPSGTSFGGGKKNEGGKPSGNYQKKTEGNGERKDFKKNQCFLFLNG